MYTTLLICLIIAANSPKQGFWPMADRERPLMVCTSAIPAPIGPSVNGRGNVPVTRGYISEFLGYPPKVKNPYIAKEWGEHWPSSYLIR